MYSIIYITSCYGRAFGTPRSSVLRADDPGGRRHGMGLLGVQNWLLPNNTDRGKTKKHQSIFLINDEKLEKPQNAMSTYNQLLFISLVWALTRVCSTCFIILFIVKLIKCHLQRLSWLLHLSPSLSFTELSVSFSSLYLDFKLKSNHIANTTSFLFSPISFS